MNPMGWKRRILASPSLPSAARRSGLANVSEQHVGALHFGQSAVVGLGDRLFDQAFLQSDSQISGHDLDDVFALRAASAEKASRERIAAFAAGPRTAAI